MFKKRQVVKIFLLVQFGKLDPLFVPKFLPFHCIYVKIKSLLEIGIDELLQKKVSVGGIVFSNNEVKFFVKNFCSWDDYENFAGKNFCG